MTSASSNAIAATMTAVVVTATALTTAAWYFNFQRRRRRRHINAVRIRPPLRHVTPTNGQRPRIIYLTGLDKGTTQEELLDLFLSGGHLPLEVDMSEVAFATTKGGGGGGAGGRAWALYDTAAEAQATVQTLHHTVTTRGCTLCARLEWGVDPDGTRRNAKHTNEVGVAQQMQEYTHTAVMRSIRPRRGGSTMAVTSATTKKKKMKEKKQQQSSKGNTIHNNNNNGPTTRCGTPSSLPPVSYSHKSLSVGPMEYPFPSGLYPTQLIQQLSQALQQDNHRKRRPLLELLSSIPKLGGNNKMQYAKELSEAMAMVDAVERGLSHLQQQASSMSTSNTTSRAEVVRDRPVTVYCLGDGKYPVAASALALYMPDHWQFVSIDPILLLQVDGEVEQEKEEGYANANNASHPKGAVSTSFQDRIRLFRGMSQDFPLPPAGSNFHHHNDDNNNHYRNELSIVIACHSHAPLEEFWNRLVVGPKLCVAMPCCAQFSELPLPPSNETTTTHLLLEYDNFEVYSPKRRIRIYYCDNDNNNNTTNADHPGN